MVTPMCGNHNKKLMRQQVVVIPAAILFVATRINKLAKGDLHVLGPIEKLLSSIIMIQYVHVFRVFLFII